MNALHRFAPLLVACVLSVAGGYTGVAQARTTDLTRTPPDLTTSVAPNIAITFDDSGSMQSYYMGDNRPFDNGGWGTKDPWMCAGAIDPRATTGAASQAMNGVYYNPNITYTPPIYANGTSFPNADATLGAVWLNGIDVNRTANAVTPNGASFLSNRNSQGDAFDKRVSNLTGVVNGKTDNRWRCTPDATNPFDGTVTDPDGNGKPNGGPYYYRLKNGVTITKADGSINTSVLYNSANWEAVSVPSSQYQNFANWFAYYRTRNMMTRTTLSQAFSKIGNSIRIAWQNMANAAAAANDTTDFDTRFGATAVLQDIGDTTATVRANFYNWMFQVVGGNSTPARAATIRAGNIFRAPLTKDSNDPYWNGQTAAADSADLVCRKNFHMLVTDGYWNEGDPSLPGNTGNQSTSMSSSNTSQVGQTLPDGKGYSPGTAGPTAIYGNVAGSVYTSSMANIAWYFWATDLQPALANGVKPYWQDLSSSTTVDTTDPGKNDDVYWNPANDPAVWQHVSQFYVTLGVAGTLDYPDDLAALRSGSKQWPRPSNNSAQAVDDTWHGGINSRGGFFNASNPQSLVTSLVSIINSVIAKSSSAVSAALSSGVISTGALTFTPSFNSTDWSGTLTAQPISDTGAAGAAEWEAGALLTARTSARLIVTSKGPGTALGAEFTYNNLTTSQKAILNSSDPSDSSSKADNLGSTRVDWIRGVRTAEGKELRTRATLLGPIINAQPVYVTYPSSGYRDYFPPSSDGTAAPETAAYTQDVKNSYSQFVADNLSRAPTLYAAANDGMLHAFDAQTKAKSTTAGQERWAFIPDASYRNLWFFSRKDNFLYYPTVDATPITRDVYFQTGSSKGWHTILVGGLRYGGRGIYALDITKPEAANVTEAASKVLWEFNSNTVAGSGNTGGANLGYTFGQPNVARLANGKWVVLVPGGYFPSDSNAPGYNAAAASNKYSSLFVLDAQTGALLKEFQTPTTYAGSAVESWGLASPVLGDYNNDQIDDVAFAGDLAGNLWRFDLRDLTKNLVDLVYRPKDDTGTGGLTGIDQPITVMPRLFPDPTSQYFIVVFGTGKFIGAEDRVTTNATTQSVYGIRDPGLGNTTGLPWTRANLVKQDLTENASGYRGLTTRTVPTTDQKGGWYFDLNISGVKGERVVVTPTALFNTNRAIITTLIPTTSDPCNPDRAGALMVIDAGTGGAASGVSGTATFASGYTLAGSRVTNPPATGNLPAATVIGGGTVLVPGVNVKGSGAPFTVGAPIWRRRSWRILNDQ